MKTDQWLSFFYWEYMLQEKRCLFVLVKMTFESRVGWEKYVYLDNYWQSISWITGSWRVGVHYCAIRKVVPSASQFIALFTENIIVNNMLLDLDWVLKEIKVCLWWNGGHWLYIFSVCYKKKWVAGVLYNTVICGSEGESAHMHF